ncbi:hypothetical protein HRF59_17820 [Bacillus velezensis]|uniref:hypothetical protein n=1 Tax=Bacillus TaxID=1386 RepID=UPI0003A9B3DE|nr:MULTISPECIES: hypothetical protein [Bacillus]ATU27770.1 hypothetical protein BMJ37_13750 [Bacillus velezensis]AUS15007.1 hypothetical protein C0W57_01895 [Bacillus velezensis]KAF1279002.1 hypothetical protein BUE72_03890 [Bacillus amyloliquefaciens]MCA1230077.1 hypothetical protein [Bacillus velezensis]MCA1308852.1 hypothetical protein [Bacillus velezensis]
MNEIFNMEFFGKVILSTITILVFNSALQLLKHWLEKKMGFHTFSMNKKYEMYPELYKKSLQAHGALLACRDYFISCPSFERSNEEDVRNYTSEILKLTKKEESDVLDAFKRSSEEASKLVYKFIERNNLYEARNKWIELNNWVNEIAIFSSDEINVIANKAIKKMLNLLVTYEIPDPKENQDKTASLKEEIDITLESLNKQIKKEIKIKS